MIFYDTETIGYHGPTVLIQWAKGVDGEIHLHEVFRSPISETLQLISDMMLNEDGICGFNLSFDHFHLCQTYTTLNLLGSRVGDDEYPIDHIEEYAKCEPEARDGVCLKPVKALDLMLHARKGPYQSTMNRSDIRIKRVPAILAERLAEELDRRIPLKEIYFAKRKNRKKQWKVYDIKDDAGEIDPFLKDVVLKFAPSSALKALANDALGIDKDKIILYADVEINDKFRAVELGYAPYALAIGTPENWNGAWPSVVRQHVSHWAFNSLARDYATDDVKYLQLLYDHFGKPESDDDDSVLACMVGAVRWHGFHINTDAIKALREEDQLYLAKVPFNYNSVNVVRKYLNQVLDETAQTVIAGSTKKIILEDLSKWTEEVICDACNGLCCDEKANDCVKCEANGFISSDKPHPVAERAKLILECRRRKKRIELFEKLLLAGRFHADFNVIGALSSRMSGAGGLNAQGINKEDEVRQCFQLAPPGFDLLGGDFDGFEVVLMDAAYNDPRLREELLSGKKIHALFGAILFSKTYEEVLATKGLPEGQNLYSRAKNGVFAMAYGGEEYTLMNRVGISEKQASEGYRTWTKRYKVWGQKRKEIFDMFCPMKQPGGLGTAVVWGDPADYIETMFGFPRYFTLENQVVKALFELSNDPPEEWQKLNIKIVRRQDRGAQKVCNALRSALLGAAFQVQAANMRAAGNHVIQGSGAYLCKALQREIWDIQPAGITNWVVLPMNIHDEVITPTRPEYVDKVCEIQKQFIEKHRDKVPLLAMGWGRLKNWNDKQ